MGGDIDAGEQMGFEQGVMVGICSFDHPLIGALERLRAEGGGRRAQGGGRRAEGGGWSILVERGTIHSTGS